MIFTGLFCASLLFGVLYTVLNIFLAIWTWSLQQQFGHQNLITDQNYAIAMFSFLIVSLIYTPIHLVIKVYTQTNKDTGSDSTVLGTCSKIILGLIGIVPSIVFLARAFVWLPRFHAAGEHHNFTMAIVYITSLLIPFGFAAALCILACVGGFAAIILGVVAD